MVTTLDGTGDRYVLKGKGQLGRHWLCTSHLLWPTRMVSYEID
jgi:hypothetical protein